MAPKYPLPMVKHAEERDRVLAMFASHKERLALV
jgi:hypothetical protein